MSGIRKEWYDSEGRKHVKIMDERGIRHLIDTDPSEMGEQPKNSGDDSNNRWYKKRIWEIVIAVTSGVILLLIGATLRHFWPRLLP